MHLVIDASGEIQASEPQRGQLTLPDSVQPDQVLRNREVYPDQESLPHPFWKASLMKLRLYDFSVLLAPAASQISFSWHTMSGSPTGNVLSHDRDSSTRLFSEAFGETSWHLRDETDSKEKEDSREELDGRWGLPLENRAGRKGRVRDERDPEANESTELQRRLGAGHEHTPH